MPSTSKAQHGYAGMSSTPKGRAKLKAEGKTPMPQKVAKDFLQADKGKTFTKGTSMKKIQHLPKAEADSGKDHHGSPRLKHTMPEQGRMAKARTGYAEAGERKTGKKSGFGGC